MTANFYEERIYLPDGMDRDDLESRNFQVGVYYRGYGKYVVARGGRQAVEQLSRSGKWLYLPAKMNQLQWCRFEFEEACQRAESVVNSVEVAGLTWVQWERRRRLIKKMEKEKEKEKEKESH